MPSSILILVSAAAIVFLLTLFFFFFQRELQNIREQLQKSLTDSARLIGDSQKTIGDRLDHTSSVVSRVERSLGSLDQATQKVFSIGQDITQLNDILRAPKLRGLIGEYFLGDLLSQILPAAHFQLQYAFKTGDIVDAIVRIGRLVPVDAKFPLENFKRMAEVTESNEKAAFRRRFVGDVKKHIDAISEKYIRPDEGTHDFALMYIPAENVYYETIIREDRADQTDSLMAYAFSKRVVPVSPNSLFAYLQTVVLGLKGLRIEENAQRIYENLSRLRNDFSRFREDFDLLGKHIANSHNKYEDAGKRLIRFEDKLLATDGPDAESLPLEVKQP